MYHLIWIPKYRKRILKGRLAERIKELLKECCELNKWEMHELSINSDHVHVIVQLRPNVAVSKAVQFFKGGSSFVIRKEFPELKEFLWGDSFWADGYFAETVGECDEEIVKKYVRKQDQA